MIPTETVYGLAADAKNSVAVRAIFEAKGRPQDNPLIVHVADRSQALSLCPPDNRSARALFERFAPGPITVVVPDDGSLAPEVNRGLGTIAIRVPAAPTARAIISAAGVPVAAPSANRSGRPSPTNFAMARAEMDGLVSAIVDGGPSTIGIESTVVDAVDAKNPRVLRPGQITSNDIALCLGLEPEILVASVDADRRARSPGTRFRHYKPGIPVVLVDLRDIERAIGELRVRFGDRTRERVWVVCSRDHHLAKGTHGFRFRDYGDYARGLFAAFWEAERAGATVILAETVDVTRAPGLADRLERAAFGRYPDVPLEALSVD